ncbi:phasin family protein [Microvirga terrestris]|uniref:Phasin family protein n=1 Tax=Microvirga terrestris TaxID=2791024 RepID=A0ABS0HR03_9HYPH|nr:phasin family protein [Microvirga terrestris]MBF9195691.1 phasin family protein [Microvirga terrestris]
MPSKHFSQTPPDKANDLFDKILATSDSATKTRERLFADLKDELELLASLQEQHLFPILQKHGMQELLSASISDNQETALLLGELERMQKSSSEFLGKVAELRKAFQQHIRDDRKQLLPAVLEVLSDEEAQAVADQVEDELANLNDLKHVETSAPADIGAAVQRSLDGVDEVVRLGADSTRTMTVGVQDLSQECLSMSQKRLQTNLDGWTKLAQCRSLQDLTKTQVSLMQENLELTLHNSFRLADLAVKLAERATWHGAIRR